jgi:hypothetical protein
VLRGAAGLGAAGLAAAAGAGAVVAATRPASTAASPPPRPRTAAGTAASTAAQPSGDPLVVYLRDAKAGEFEVFRGTQQVKVRNPKLVAQLLDGIATAQ